MGKVEDLRALRELLRGAEAAAMAPKANKGKRARGITAAREVLEEIAPSDELCGHRSIGNKPCIRLSNHAEKNHRYAKTEKT